MVSNVEVEKYIEERSKKGKETCSKDVSKNFGISLPRANVHLSKLVKRHKIVETHRGQGGLRFFMHVKYAPKPVIQFLKEKLCRNPTIEEIAYKMGQDLQDSEFRKRVYEVAEEIKWKEPSKEEIEEGQELAYLRLVIATLDRHRKDPKLQKYFQTYPGVLVKDKKKLEISRKYARKFKELLPKIEISGKELKFIWPKEAKEVIVEVDDEGKKPVNHWDWDVERCNHQKEGN
jgi:hypothetical protein